MELQPEEQTHVAAVETDAGYAHMKGPTITLQPQAWVFAVDVRQTILRSAEAEGVELPSSCRNGTCRTCMCLARQGAVQYRIEWPGLSAEEKAEGWILPCVAYPVSDLVLETPLATRV